MTIDEYLQYHEDICSAARDLGRRKNNDYACPTMRETDPLGLWANFRLCEHMNVCTTEQGIIVRLTDKISRLANILRPGHNSEVSDEKAEDTLQDIINYSALLSAYLRAKKRLEHSLPNK